MPSFVSIGADLYRNQCVVSLTQHRKGSIIDPVLRSAIGCRAETVPGFDTDLLGTFTRDIPRQDTNPRPEAFSSNTICARTATRSGRR